MALRIHKGRKIEAAAPTPQAKVLSVPQIGQKEPNWCWAGCTQMVLHFYGRSDVQQCELANLLFKTNRCCSEPSRVECNQPCPIDKITHVYTHWQVQATFHTSDLIFSQVQSELNAGRPVAVGLEWSGGGGHEVIIRGWDIDASGQRLRINDPAKGSGFQYYSDLVTAYGQGKWKWTWTGIKKSTKD